MGLLKFIYSEKATKFCEISTLFLSYAVPVKSKVEIPQICVAFSEYMSFNTQHPQYQNPKYAPVNTQKISKFGL